jgi:hypothetical protein
VANPNTVPARKKSSGKSSEKVKSAEYKCVILRFFVIKHTFFFFYDFLLLVAIEVLYIHTARGTREALELIKKRKLKDVQDALKSRKLN